MEPFPKRRALPHEVPIWIDPAKEVYFLPLCAKPRGESHLCRLEIPEKLIESARFKHDSRAWFVHLFLLMPDHLHSLITFSENEKSIKTAISSWKSFTAKTLGITWQPNFFEHRLRNDENFQEKADYIRNNPVGAGLVTTPADWPHQFAGR